MCMSSSRTAESHGSTRCCSGRLPAGSSASAPASTRSLRRRGPTTCGASSGLPARSRSLQRCRRCRAWWRAGNASYSCPRACGPPTARRRRSRARRAFSCTSSASSGRWRFHSRPWQRPPSAGMRTKAACCGTGGSSISSPPRPRRATPTASRRQTCCATSRSPRMSMLTSSPGTARTTPSRYRARARRRHATGLAAASGTSLARKCCTRDCSIGATICMRSWWTTPD
mmetsp:Transcript_3104/g.9028  ORF Transcript_3104/g.9028 Transcript_3104/m.9028 type:complete len:228 (+) Transcript_3104:438-1121(+)